MTDNEIIVPLKCLVMNESDCRHCKLKDKNDKCQKFLYSDVLGLIDENNRQNAEIERLKKENEAFAELEQGCYVTGYKKIRAEAIKEFAERFLKKVHDKHYLLSDRVNSKDYGMFTIGIEQAVNETKEEMAGDAE